MYLIHGEYYKIAIEVRNKPRVSIIATIIYHCFGGTGNTKIDKRVKGIKIAEELILLFRDGFRIYLRYIKESTEKTFINNNTMQ